MTRIIEAILPSFWQENCLLRVMSFSKQLITYLTKELMESLETALDGLSWMKLLASRTLDFLLSCSINLTRERRKDGKGLK